MPGLKLLMCEVTFKQPIVNNGILPILSGEHQFKSRLEGEIVCFVLYSMARKRKNERWKERRK